MMWCFNPIIQDGAPCTQLHTDLAYGKGKLGDARTLIRKSSSDHHVRRDPAKPEAVALPVANSSRTSGPRQPWNPQHMRPALVSPPSCDSPHQVEANHQKSTAALFLWPDEDRDHNHLDLGPPFALCQLCAAMSNTLAPGPCMFGSRELLGREHLDDLACPSHSETTTSKRGLPRGAFQCLAYRNQGLAPVGWRKDPWRNRQNHTSGFCCIARCFLASDRYTHPGQAHRCGWCRRAAH